MLDCLPHLVLQNFPRADEFNVKKHKVEIQQLKDGNDDCYLEFPPILLEGLGWKEGDDLKFLPQCDGSFIVKKVNLETVEMDFDEDELLKYMQLAHEQGLSLNEFIEKALEQAMGKSDFEKECG